ncbi:MAG: helix-turn-helix transcriptional regulator [Xanthobacteraceae bacterium]|nr:helix-turn-helix transcriptional regulator [Xanthobacteraceae bacterium]
MSSRFKEIGQRLRAYRLGRGLTANEIAERIGVSRAAVYRLEKGELVKIETIEKLAELLDVSLPSLMGVEVEYYNNAISFFERMRQLEESATHVLGNFSPISFLLLSDNYIDHLRTMLNESLRDIDPKAGAPDGQIEKLLEILRERREAAKKRRTPVVSIVGSRDLERFLRLGLIGRFDLAPDVAAERRRAAREEIARFIRLMQNAPIGVQVGVVVDTPPTQTFQVFEIDNAPAVTLSPYRLGDQPNISSGIALATSAPEAVRLFKNTITGLWGAAHKGEAGARVLRIGDELRQRASGDIRR